MLEAKTITLMRGERLILAQTSFHVPKGGILLLKGDNGSGKTSLLRAAAGLLPLKSGKFIKSAQAQFLSAHPLPAEPATPYDSLKTLSALYKVPFNLAADPFNIEPFLHTPLMHLSSGQRQRVKLSSLVLLNRPLWLLDEPTTALDQAATQSLITYLNAHLANGGSALIATHQAPLWPTAPCLDMVPA